MAGNVSRLKRLRYLAEDRLVEAVSSIVQRHPMARVRTWGETLGRTVYRAARSRRRVALDNLAHAFPGMSVTERERIVRGMFEHFGRMTLELIRFRTLTEAEMLALSDVEGGEHVDRAYEQGKGVVFFGGHIGYWEQQAIAHAVSWKPASVMVRPLDNPALHDLIEHIRTRTGNAVIYRQGSIRKVLRALAGNRGVAILIDQHLHTSDAVHVNFFGRPAATTSIVAALVQRTGAATIPVFGFPLAGGRYRFVYGPPVAPPRDGSPEAALDFTQRCTDVLEACIRTHPGLWLWMHRRWRGGPDQHASVTGRRVSTDGTAGRRDADGGAGEQDRASHG